MNRLGIILILAIISTIFGCKEDVAKENNKIYFGIYQLFNLEEVPDQVVDSLMKPGFIKANNPHMSIIGYKPLNDSIGLYQYNDGEFALFETKYTVDTDGGFVAVVVLERSPVIGLADIKEVRPIAGNVELVFTEIGKAKWEKITADNIGKRITMVVGEHIYSMPYINKPISTGVAQINGIDNEKTAIKLSEALNNSIPKVN